MFSANITCEDDEFHRSKAIVEKMISEKNSSNKNNKRGSFTILIIEDNPDNMTTIKAVLGNRYHILEAVNGESGLEMAIEYLPNLILLDMALPQMDGFEVVRNLKQDKNTRSIHIIAITALAMKGDREKILEVGCDDYISKPIDPMSTIKKVKMYLGEST